GLPRELGRTLPVATLRQRLSVARRPEVLVALLGTTLWATGAYTVYTYIATYVGAAGGPLAGPPGPVGFLWGLSALSGMIAGGGFTDLLGPRRILAASLAILALAFAGLSTIAAFVPPASAPTPILVAIILWGMSAWGFVAPQQARLIGLVG